MLEIAPSNPRRPTDWRWQRACLLSEGTPATEHLSFNRRIDDEWVRQAASFKRQLDTCDDDADRRSLMNNSADLYWAHDIYQDEGNPYKSELEARLLSRDDAQGISRRLGVEPGTVQMYEKLFYNVENKLDTPGYVYHTAIGREMHRGFTEREYDKLWKWYAYAYGSLMLDSVIGQAIDATVPENQTQVKAAWKDDGMASIIRKQAIAARTMPVNSFTQADLLHIWTKFVEIEKSAEASGAGSSALLANVEALLDLAPTMLVGKRIHDDDFPALDTFDKQGHELRTHELLMIATGESPPGLEETLNSLTFPETTSHEKTEQGS